MLNVNRFFPRVASQVGIFLLWRNQNHDIEISNTITRDNNHLRLLEIVINLHIKTTE